MTSLCGAWWFSNTIFMANTFDKSRKALLERHPLSQNKKLFTFAFTHTESHETNTAVQ